MASKAHVRTLGSSSFMYCCITVPPVCQSAGAPSGVLWSGDPNAPSNSKHLHLTVWLVSQTYWNENILFFNSWTGTAYIYLGFPTFFFSMVLGYILLSSINHSSGTRKINTFNDLCINICIYIYKGVVEGEVEMLNDSKYFYSPLKCIEKFCCPPSMLSNIWREVKIKNGHFKKTEWHIFVNSIKSLYSCIISLPNMDHQEDIEDKRQTVLRNT